MMDWDNITQTGARASGVEQRCCSNGGGPPSGCPRHRSRSARLPRRAPRMKANWNFAVGMSGADLTEVRTGRLSSDKPAFEPHWGKPAVRNLRGDDGDVGIIRSPVRAIVLPDNLSSWRKPTPFMWRKAVSSCPLERGGQESPESE